MGKAKFSKPEDKKVVNLSTLDTSQPLFKGYTMNETMERAKNMEIPRMLFSEFIYEKDLTILYSPAGVGKTILAYQIADSIARGTQIAGFKNESQPQPTIYFDFELSEKQVENRYSQNFEDTWVNHYNFSDNFHRYFFNNEFEGNLSIDSLFNGLITEILNKKAKIVFIDNITWINNQGLETSKDAGLVMKKLISLKREYNLTLIVLAHTPKKLRFTKMEINNLQGSAMIGNFTDASFSINWSKLNTNYRYLKTQKCRYAEDKYHSKNVITLEVKYIEPNFLGYEMIQPDMENVIEDNHLTSKDDVTTKVFTKEKLDERTLEVKNLLKENPDLSSRQLEDETGVNRTTCARIKKEFLDGN